MEEDDNLTPKIMQEKEESKEPKLFLPETSDFKHIN